MKPGKWRGRGWKRRTFSNNMKEMIAELLYHKLLCFELLFIALNKF
jgi:hypothetical protein